MCLTFSLFFALLDKVKSWSSSDVHKINLKEERRKISEENNIHQTFQRAKTYLKSFGKGGKTKKSPSKRREIIVISKSADVPNRFSQVSQDSSVSSASSNMSADDAVPDEDRTKFSQAFLSAREILTTEQTFNNVLQMLVVDFKENITSLNQSKNEIVPQSQFDRIFSNLTMLHAFSSQLLCSLRNRIENWDGAEVIADVIAKDGAFLKMFATYTEDFQNNRPLFENLQEKWPKFKEAAKSFEKQPICKNMTLASYFLKPVQRLPQYELLLKNYIKHLDQNGPDFANATKALEIVSKAANHVNDLMAKNANFRNLLNLQNRLVNYDKLIR